MTHAREQSKLVTGSSSALALSLSNSSGAAAMPGPVILGHWDGSQALQDWREAIHVPVARAWRVGSLPRPAPAAFSHVPAWGVPLQFSAESLKGPWRLGWVGQPWLRTRAISGHEPLDLTGWFQTESHLITRWPGAQELWTARGHVARSALGVRLNLTQTQLHLVSDQSMCFLSFQAQRPVLEGLENETLTWCPGTTHPGAQVLEAMTLETFLLRLSFPFITPCRFPSHSIGTQCLFYFSLGFSLMGK